MQRMKQIFVLFLALSMLAQSAVKTGILIYFYTNQTTIAAEKCENKANVALKCNGKCQLGKWMKKAEETPESKSPAAPDMSKLKEITLFAEALPHVFAVITETSFVRSSLPLYSERRVDAPVFDIFHPPG